MDKPNITQLVYIDNKTKREALQVLKDNEVLIPINFYLHKNGHILYFELVEEDKENKEKQIIEKIDEDGNTYFDLI